MQKNELNPESGARFIEQAFPEHWYDYARELYECAEFIWARKGHEIVPYVIKGGSDVGSYRHRPNVSRTVFLLLALAVENLLKGIRVSEEPSLLSGGKLSPTITRGHSLSRLRDDIKSVRFSKSDSLILEVFEELLPYWGRYPVPKDFSGLKAEKYLDTKTFEASRKLFNKLVKAILKLNANGTQEVDGVRFPIFRVIDARDDVSGYETFLSEIRKLRNS